MRKAKRITYTVDFKKRAVEMVGSGTSIRGVAKKLGVNINSIRAWMGKNVGNRKIAIKKGRKSEVQKNVVQVVQKEMLSKDSTMVSLLRSELVRLEERVELIKKTIACFRG